MRNLVECCRIGMMVHHPIFQHSILPVRNFLMTAALSILICSCGGTEKPTQHVNIDSLKDPLMDANKIYVKKESDDIDQYVRFKKLNVTESGTGLRYLIYNKGTGMQAKMGMYAKVSYKISLLDGTLCYAADKKHAKEFLIGQDNVESGLHEGVTYMHVGDKAILILPSHLAHGLLGDEDKIPPRSSVVYDIELISVR